VRIIGGFFRNARRSLRERQFSVVDGDERLAWLIVIATIPIGLTGVALSTCFAPCSPSRSRQARFSSSTS